MKVLVIGLGSIAQKHVAALRKTDPGAEIIALRSSEQKEDQPEGIRCIYNHGEIDTDIDFIMITNPTNMHAGTIKACLDLGKPLFIEKPLFHSLAYESLVKEISASGIPNYVACNMRFHPALVFLKQHIASGAQRINEVNIYCGSYLPEWRPGKDFRALYSASPEQGGGVHLDLIHEIDYAYWLFGSPLTVSSLKRNVSHLGIQAIDSASYHLSYPEFTVSIALNYFRRDPKRQVEIVSETGTWTTDLLDCTITSDTGDVIFRKEGYQVSDTYISQLRYFIDLVAGNAPLMNDVNEAFTVLKIALHEEA